MIREEDFRRLQQMVEKIHQEQSEWNKLHVEKMHDQQRAVEEIIMTLLQSPSFTHKFESLKQHYQSCSGRTIVVDKVSADQSLALKLQQNNTESDDSALEDILNMLRSQGKTIVSVKR